MGVNHAQDPRSFSTALSVDLVVVKLADGKEASSVVGTIGNGVEAGDVVCVIHCVAADEADPFVEWPRQVLDGKLCFEDDGVGDCHCHKDSPAGPDQPPSLLKRRPVGLSCCHHRSVVG